MHSPLECISGSFSSAVFATYSLNLRFFEHWVVPRLHAAGVRNVIVFADETELGAALEDHGLRGVGRSYHVVSARLGAGRFHPKLIFLHGEAGRARVSPPQTSRSMANCETSKPPSRSTAQSRGIKPRFTTLRTSFGVSARTRRPTRLTHL